MVFDGYYISEVRKDSDIGGDVLRLKDGRVLIIAADAVVLYKDMMHLWVAFGKVKTQCIDLNQTYLSPESEIPVCRSIGDEMVSNFGPHYMDLSNDHRARFSDMPLDSTCGDEVKKVIEFYHATHKQFADLDVHGNFARSCIDQCSVICFG